MIGFVGYLIECLIGRGANFSTRAESEAFCLHRIGDAVRFQRRARARAVDVRTSSLRENRFRGRNR